MSELGAKVPPVFKTNNMKEKNNCYQCSHRREVPGSAHSECALGAPVIFSMIAFTKGNILAGYCDENGNAFLQFDPHGVKMGWCTWPVNFDPVWVECYLPIEKTESNG